jgi:hypothetical protein
LSGHRALHAAAAETLCLAPTGRIAQLGQATSRALELAREEGDHTCKTALVALAGRALWLFETLEPDAAFAAVELLDRLRPSTGRPMYDYVIAETLRPFLGVEHVRAMIERLDPPGARAAEAILCLRARLPVLALSGERDLLDDALAEAQRLAHKACAPALGWIAEWAAAARTAADRCADALARAQVATAALADYGERYTAARLLLDFVPLTDGSAAGQLADEAAKRFDAMGALASAAEARAATAGSRPPFVSG